MTHTNNNITSMSAITDIIHGTGLLTGKMGLALFFAKYGIAKQNNAYKKLSDLLLDQIWDSLPNENQIINFSSGLSGIGWGVEYLLQNNLVKGDSNTICKDIDQIVMEYDSLMISDCSIQTGLPGILCYVLARIKGNNSLHRENPFSPKYLSNLFDKAVYIYYHDTDLFNLTITESFIKYSIEKRLEYNMNLNSIIKIMDKTNNDIIYTTLRNHNDLIFIDNI